MKKMLFSLVLALVALRGFSQNMDSLAVVQEVDSLIQISRTFTSKGDFGKALEINAAAEKLAIEKLGRETVVYGNACYNHASILYYKDDYPEAEKWYMESKVIREKTLGKKHPDYANSLTGLATMYLRLSNFVKAEPLCLEAKNILENAPDRKPLDYAASLHNLAWLYHEMGNLEKAEPLYLESIALREKVLGKDPADLDLGWSLNNLANVYWQMGDYEKAEQLHLGTITIRAKALGKENILYIVSLINLASLYLDIGNYRKAEQLYLEAKNIFEVGLKNREHFFYILCLNNMANLYTLMGDVEKAEQLYLEAKRIWEATLNSNNSPQYAKNLLSLASLASKKRNYEKAESLTLEAKTIWENKLGKEHPDYAMSLFGLANIYTAMGNYEKAESLYLETKGILEKTAGKENTKYAACLEALTNLYWVTGNLVAAKAFLMETNASERKRFTKASRHLSERELSSYLAKFKYGANSAFSFAQTHSDLFNTCYDNTLFHKGFLLNAVSQIRRLALTDSISTEKYYLLKACNRLLSAEYAKPISKRKKVSELEEQANTLEKELAHHVSGLGEAIRQVNWQEVQAKLKPEEVAIEFVHYRFVSPKSTRPNIYYAALLLRSGETQSLFLPLFEEKQLDSLLQTHNERKADYVNNLYTHTKRGIVRTDKPVKSIYQLIWQPIDSLLNSPAAERRRGEAVKTIYFSPSGLLHRLNLAAIPIGHDSVLADRYQLVQFGSTRQIVIQNQTTVASNTAVLFGGIRYDVDTTAIQKPSADWNMSDAAAGSRGNFSFAYSDTVFRGGVWDYLPFTEKEVASIEKTLKSGGAHTQTLTGNAATEAFLKSVGHGKSSPRTLHIATHGFFFPDPKDTTYRSAPAFGGSWGETESIFKTADNPLMRSGLILAGANQTWSGGKTPEGQEDGILTAYEISQMNLSNTELVVLSACETGLGDIQGNEGVYGLQRAFKIAGAKYLIMSLWQVPDKQTSLLMTTFYKKWLEEKMEIPEAFRAAQKEMREQSLDPYQWAGFVLVE